MKVATHALGSGVFIPAGLSITAKRVMQAFWNRMGSGIRFQGERPLECEVSAQLMVNRQEFVEQPA
jgi:hypothetical protein